MAFALLIAFLIPSAGFYVEIIRVSADARNRIEAGNLAAQQIELARATAFSTLAAEVGTTGAGCQPNVSECWTDQQAGITYKIAQGLTWVNESNEADACGGLGNGSSGVQPLLAVTDKVTWLDMPPTMPVEAQTDIFTPPGDYPETTGNLGVSVVDSYGAPVVDALVTMTNADTPHNSITVPTGQTGCAFVAYLPTGNYSVSAELTGYVDQWENSTASESAVALGAGDTVGVTLDYAPADVVEVTWPSAVTLPAVGYYPVTVVNPGLSEPGTGSVALPNDAAPAPLQLQLWPYSNGYEIYPGGCTDSDPGLYGIAETSFAVSQGWTTWLPGPLQLYPLPINGQDASGPVRHLQVTVTDATPACADNTYPFAKVAGDSTTIGLPLGTFNITVKAKVNGNPVSATFGVDVGSSGPVPSTETVTFS